MDVKKKDPIYVGFATEPYSPPHPLPKDTVILPPAKSYELPQKRVQRTSPNIMRTDEKYSPPSELSRYLNRTIYRKTRGKRLV